VNASCTAIVKPIIPGLPPSEIRMVIVDGGKEFRTFEVSPQPVMVVGHARKVNQFAHLRGSVSLTFS
jgi:hypothetical protein